MNWQLVLKILFAVFTTIYPILFPPHPVGQPRRGPIRKLIWNRRHPQPAPIPIPTPQPTPPVPIPVSPAPVAGFKVMIVYDSQTILPQAQTDVLTSVPVRTWLNATCVKDGWRLFDKSTQVAGDSEFWKTALTRPRTSLPWLMVWTAADNVKPQYEGVLPGNVADTVTLLKKYAQ